MRHVSMSGPAPRPDARRRPVGIPAWLAVLGGGLVIQTAAFAATLRDVPERQWRALATQRVWFGHQSVGGDIMEGVAELAGRLPGAPLRVATVARGGAGQGWFAHGPVGRNREPRVKTDDFARRMDAAPGGVDIAFHKYCYADIEQPTDVAALFQHYRRAMERLRARHPGVVFVHVTTPLQTARPTWRATVKRWLGRAYDRYEDNAARERFNDLMRRAYAGREPLFDLAAIQSTRPDGTREVMTSRGRRTYALVPAYASDGSHLNALGQRRVAEELLVFLARLPHADGRRTAQAEFP